MRAATTFLLTLSIPAPQEPAPGEFPTLCAIERQKLVSSDPGNFALFHVVDIDADVAAVGAWSDSAAIGGIVYVYRRLSGVWVEEQTLLADDPSIEDRFGIDVAISGGTMVVGAYLEDEVDPTEPFDDSGAAYVFEREASGWVRTAKLLSSDLESGDHFGQSVGISDDTIVLGAPGKQELGQFSGAAYVFARTATGWREQARLRPGGLPLTAELGHDVDVDGPRVVVGARSDGTAAPFAGAAYVFVRRGDIWFEEAQLLASDPDPNDLFGAAVGISGDRVLVGSTMDAGPFDSTGAAYAFEREAEAWVQTGRLVPAEITVSARVGSGVDLEGGRALVGADAASTLAPGAGAAYLFEWNGAQWVERARMLASDGAAGNRLGLSAAIHGDTALAGAAFAEVAGLTAGAVYAFGLLAPELYCSGKVHSGGCASALALSGTPAVLGAGGFRIRAVDALSGRVGVLLYGFGRAALDFHGGKLCIKAPLARARPAKVAKTVGVGPCSGVLGMDFNAVVRSGIDPGLVAGATVRAQWLQRDPLDPARFGDTLSNAVEFVICP